MMIKPEIILSQLEDALKDVEKAKAGRPSMDDRVSIAEMIVNLQMQLDMLGKVAHVRFDPKLNALKAAATAANIEWQLA